MIRNLVERFRAARTARQLDRLPAIQCGRRAIESYWTANKAVTKDFPVDAIRKQAEELWSELVRVATSPDPRMANREALADGVVESAKFQVITIDPPPAPDPAGLLGQPGISGELKARLVEIAEKDNSLREYMQRFDAVRTWDDVWNPLLFRYRTSWAWSCVFHAVRYAFDDINPAEGKDWYRPFVAATCAWQEHQYRRCLGMPPSLDESAEVADAKALVMATFKDFVIRGDRYPDLAWNDLKKSSGLHWS